MFTYIEFKIILVKPDNFLKMLEFLRQMKLNIIQMYKYCDYIAIVIQSTHLEIKIYPPKIYFEAATEIIKSLRIC